MGSEVGSAYGKAWRLQVTVVDHHSVFGAFSPRKVPTAEGFVQDSFLGTVRRSAIYEVPDQAEVGDNDAVSFPPFGEEYFEWIDLLESVVSARGTYTFAELGAGFGRWSVRAAFAAQQLRSGMQLRGTADRATADRPRSVAYATPRRSNARARVQCTYAGS